MLKTIIITSKTHYSTILRLVGYYNIAKHVFHNINDWDNKNYTRINYNYNNCVWYK